MTYNQISTNYKAYEVCLYFKDENGIETLEGLYNWQSKDATNRLLFEFDNYANAYKVINSKKLLRQLVGH